METELTIEQAERLLFKSGIRRIGNFNKISLFILPRTARVVGVFYESLLSVVSGDLKTLNHCGGISIPLMDRKAFIEALIHSLNPDEQFLVDSLVKA